MGTLDGVHLGHQAILKRAVALARRSRLTCVALTFARPPRLLFSPQPGPQLLTTPQEKRELMLAHGVDRAVFLPFNKDFARLSAEDFFQKYLLRRFHARAMVVGYNFRFGRGREGDVAHLASLGRRYGVRVEIVRPVKQGLRPVSSGQIRALLEAGQVEKANAKLGFPYLVTGVVRRHKGLGKRLGYPTANVVWPSEKIVPPGVFAVRVLLPNGFRRGGMANVGTRPTLHERAPQRHLEVNIFDFNSPLAGRKLGVEFIKRLREEKKFPSLKHLQSQLAKDERQARRILSD